MARFASTPMSKPIPRRSPELLALPPNHNNVETATMAATIGARRRDANHGSHTDPTLTASKGISELCGTSSDLIDAKAVTATADDTNERASAERNLQPSVGSCWSQEILLDATPSVSTCRPYIARRIGAAMRRSVPSLAVGARRTYRAVRVVAIRGRAGQ